MILRYTFIEKKSTVFCSICIISANTIKLWFFFCAECTRFNLFDATILTRPVYELLKDDTIFKNPVIEYGVITWNDGSIDYSPEYIYKNSYEYPEVSSF